MARVYRAQPRVLLGFSLRPLVIRAILKPYPNPLPHYPMPDRKFTIHNGGKQDPVRKPESHRRHGFWAIFSVVAGVSALGLAIYATSSSRIAGVNSQKRQTTCLTWEEQGKNQVQCSGKIYVEKALEPSK